MKIVKGYQITRLLKPCFGIFESRRSGLSKIYCSPLPRQIHNTLRWTITGSYFMVMGPVTHALTCTIPSNSHTTDSGIIVTIILTYKWRNWGPERFSYLSKVTQMEWKGWGLNPHPSDSGTLLYALPPNETLKENKLLVGETHLNASRDINFLPP